MSDAWEKLDEALERAFNVAHREALIAGSDNPWAAAVVEVENHCAGFVEAMLEVEDA